MAARLTKIIRQMRAKHIHWAMDLYPDLLPVLGTQTHPFAMRIATTSMQKMYARADRIIAISGCMARYLKSIGVPQTKIQTIENWPDRDGLDDDDANAPVPLLDGHKFRILYAGTIGLAHDFDSVIKAAIYFQKTDPDIEFVFTKRGRGAPILEKRILEEGLINIRSA